MSVTEAATRAPQAGGEATTALRADAPKHQSYWSLVWWKFKKNRMAIVGAIIVLSFYFVCALFAEFFAPYHYSRTSAHLEAPPQLPRFIDADGNFHLRPFVHGYEVEIDMVQRRRVYTINTDQVYPLYFFVRGEPYRLWGLIPGEIRLFGTGVENPEAHAYIFGTDRLGRDLFSRIIYGGRLSLMIGLIGQFITLLLGSILGAVSGYYGGGVDMFIQRVIEFLAAFPSIPLYMALAAAIPPQWSPFVVYFMLTLILALLAWGELARQLRGMILAMREREFVLAARSFGVSDWKIMMRHLIPNSMSHIIVIATLSIPAMILAETALSFLGLGLRPPLTSWGVLLQEVQTVRALRFAPWLLIPAPFIILVIMGFNFLGDGLRDALDPYSSR